MPGVPLYFETVLNVTDAQTMLQRPTCRFYARQGHGVRGNSVYFPILFDTELGGFDLKFDTATKLAELKDFDKVVRFYLSIAPTNQDITIHWHRGRHEIIAVGLGTTPLSFPWLANGQG